MKDRRLYYNSIAEGFDSLMNPYDLQRRLEILFDELLDGIDLARCRLLDAGCGTGHFSLRARELGAQVVSLDLGPRLLRVARGKGLRRLMAGDVTELPFATGAFDLVLSSECIEHTVSPRAAVTEMARVLRPGGRLVLSCPNRFWHWSCVVANRLGLRPYQGLENWPGWWQLAGWVEAAGVSVQRHQGLHLFPFVLKASHRLLRLCDRAGALAGPLYVNQALLGFKT